MKVRQAGEGKQWIERKAGNRENEEHGTVREINRYRKHNDIGVPRERGRETGRETLQL